LTTRPSLTSRHGMTRVFSVIVIGATYCDLRGERDILDDLSRAVARLLG
jgi:hypothetical protein